MWAVLATALLISALSASAPSPLRVGLMIGEPISATIGFTLTERFILHADIGPSTTRNQDAVAAADLVYTFPEVLSTDRSQDYFVPWFGLGLRYSDGRDEEPNRFGPRAPFGVSYFTGDHAIEIFASVAPGVSFAPDLRASLDAGIGVRLAL